MKLRKLLHQQESYFVIVRMSNSKSKSIVADLQLSFGMFVNSQAIESCTIIADRSCIPIISFGSVYQIIEK